MRRLKEIEDRFKKLIDAIIEARVKQAMVPMDQEYNKTLSD
jgi:hypothetical protein